MLLDGKDHSQGKGAYDWHGFKTAYKSFSYVLKTEPAGDLNFDHLMKARDICCKTSKTKENTHDHHGKDTPQTNHDFDWAGEHPGKYEGPVFRRYGCLECEHMKQLIAETPPEFMTVKHGKNSFAKTSTVAVCDDIERVRLKPKSIGQTKKYLKELIAKYNTEVLQLATNDEKLVRLATFLKEFAFLHPWGNGNGRFRTMIMNREVRRLGLGCGAMMYNNNKDLYFLKLETYIAKIKEGLSMYDRAVTSGISPWVDEAVVAKHKVEFAPEITMPGLLDCKAANTRKGSVE